MVPHKEFIVCTTCVTQEPRLLSAVTRMTISPKSERECDYLSNDDHAKHDLAYPHEDGWTAGFRSLLFSFGILNVRLVFRSKRAASAKLQGSRRAGIEALHYKSLSWKVKMLVPLVLQLVVV